MLEGIKSKLGFADANPHYDDGYYDEGFDDYSEEYGEYGPDYNEDDFPADDAPGSRYEPYAPVTSRPARASHARSSARSSSVGSAKLVSSTSDDAPSVSGPSGSGVAVQTATTASGATVATATATTAAFDPFDAYAGAGAVKHNPSRSVTVLKPASYAEVERIAKALKAGDVVVLALRNTPDNLSKRILDFSFGVSSALDASVDCVADKVFVISRGAALTDAERMSLRGQGVL